MPFHIKNKKNLIKNLRKRTTKSKIAKGDQTLSKKISSQAKDRSNKINSNKITILKRGTSRTTFKVNLLKKILLTKIKQPTSRQKFWLLSDKYLRKLSK